MAVTPTAGYNIHDEWPTPTRPQPPISSDRQRVSCNIRYNKNAIYTLPLFYNQRLPYAILVFVCVFTIKQQPLTNN